MSKKFIDFYREAVTQKAAEGGGGEITKQALSVSENGVYTAPSGKAYSPVTVNVPQVEKQNPYLPNESDGYTEYADLADLTVSDIRDCGIGSTLNAKIALNSGISVGDKVLLTGTLQSGGSDVVLYAVWGTVDYYHDYATYSRIRFVVAGSSIRPFTGDTVSISSNGVYEVFGASKVDVDVESLQTDTLYATENGDYFPESGYAYSEVHVDVQGGSEPNLQDKTVSVVQNGTQVVEPDTGYDGLNSVEVNVNVPTPTPSVQSKSVTITQNGTTHVTPDSGYDGMDDVAVTVNVPTGGGGDTFADFLDGNLATYSNSAVQSLRKWCLSRQTFTSLSLTGLTFADDYAFQYATVSDALNLSALETVAGNVFQNANIPVNSDFSSLKTITGKNCFQSCKFSGTGTLYFPELQTIGGTYCFASNSSETTLKSIKFDKLEATGTYMFNNRGGLELVDFGYAITSFSNSTFQSARKCVVIIRNPNAVPTLGAGGITPNTCSAVYVPDALVDDYKAATNWSNIADIIYPLSEYVPS